MMSFSWFLLAAVALSCTCVQVQGMIENYAELWNKTLQEMPPPEDTFHILKKDCKGTQFVQECPKLSRTNPTSVHLLTPADIDYVGAIGDSITAGFGAKASNIFDGALTEYRGVSWSIGGEGDGDPTSCATLPNILKVYNPSVIGASTGTGDENSASSWYNKAVSGAESPDIMTQAINLVNKMKASMSDDDYKNKWKLVTLWIGGNDLCACCSDMNKYSAANYVARIKDTLIYLRDNIPRTLVNVPQALDVTKIAELSGLICGVVKLFACDCASRSATKGLVKEYQDAIKTLYDETDLLFGDDGFTFVIQPFFIGVDVPRENGDPDMSFFAPDCFHMSVKGHRALAAALWSNMLSRPGDKVEAWDPYNTLLKCPDTGNPYIYTEKTEQLLAQSQGFHAEQQNTDSDGSNGDSQKASLGLIFGSIVGSAAGLYLVVVAVGVGIGGAIWWRRRRPNPSPSETIPLVKQR